MLANLNSDLFWSLFHTGIPTCVYVMSISFGMLGSIILLLRKSVSNKHILAIWITVVLFLMLYSTVIGRLEGLSGSICPNGSSVHLIPFWSLGAIKDGLIEVLYEKIYNVLFFIPYGVLIGLWLKVYGLWNFMKKSMAVGFLTSVGIELLQLITRTGTCETDDVICNTLGCLIGAMVAYGCIRLFKWFKWFKWFKRYDK